MPPLWEKYRRDINYGDGHFDDLETMLAGEELDLRLHHDAVGRKWSQANAREKYAF